MTLAEATNDSGEVTTSSPSPTPTARSARCSAAVPDETALAWRGPHPPPHARPQGGARGRRGGGERERPRANHLNPRSPPPPPQHGGGGRHALARRRPPAHPASRSAPAS